MLNQPDIGQLMERDLPLHGPRPGDGWELKPTVIAILLLLVVMAIALPFLAVLAARQWWKHK